MVHNTCSFNQARWQILVDIRLIGWIGKFLTVVSSMEVLYITSLRMRPARGVATDFPSLPKIRHNTNYKFEESIKNKA